MGLNEVHNQGSWPISWRCHARVKLDGRTVRCRRLCILPIILPVLWCFSTGTPVRGTNVFIGRKNPSSLCHSDPANSSDAAVWRTRRESHLEQPGGRHLVWPPTTNASITKGKGVENNEILATLERKRRG
jgi:hypothetical protein